MAVLPVRLSTWPFGDKTMCLAARFLEQQCGALTLRTPSLQATVHNVWTSHCLWFTL
jgi:hypothetical protein